jgi:hypothetical protein
MDPIQNGWDWYYTNAVSYSVTINGITYSGTIDSYVGSGTLAVRSDTISVAHGADGKKTINYSFSVSSYNVSYLPGTAANSGSMTLTNIPRQATIGSAPNFNDEANPQITYTNSAGNSVESLQACISLTGSAADVPYRDIPKTGTSYTFNLTAAERATLRNATTGNSRNVIFYVKTVVGGVTYYSTLTRTLSIINADPTLVVDAVDTNSITKTLTGDAHRYIRHYSNVQVSATATAKKGAGIKSTTGTGKFNSVTTNSFKVTTTDTRGNSTEKTYTGTLIPYVYLTTNFKPRINVSGRATIDIKGNYFNGSFGAYSNTLTIEYRYKQDNNAYSEWITYSGATKSNNEYSGQIAFDIPNFNYRSQYSFQIYVADRLAELYPSVYTTSAKPVFDWGEADFNFNVPISFENVQMEDFVVETGTSGIWNYRKWNSGKAECWGRYTHSTVLNTAWGSMFVGNTKSSKINYPFQFAETPVETATLQASNYAAWLYAESGATGYNSSSQTASYNVCRPTTGGTSTHTFYISLYVVGRWK